MPRPRGTPKTGGRRPGSRNKTTRDIQTLARSHGPLAVKTLAQIAGDENLSPDARIRASAELLNRGYGKPVEFREEHREQVTCEESGRSVKDMSQDEIDAEIEAILSRREERKAFQEQIGYKPPVKALMRS